MVDPLDGVRHMRYGGGSSARMHHAVVMERARGKWSNGPAGYQNVTDGLITGSCSSSKPYPDFALPLPLSAKGPQPQPQTLSTAPGESERAKERKSEAITIMR